MSAEKLVDTIFLSPQSSGLNEVVVQGNMPTIQLQGSALQVNIQGTVLANESSIIDVLRKTPGLIANDGNITTIEGYTPSYYLNGRKVSSLSEIKNLDVKSIMSVALDTSPGARYSSSEKAVVNIRTTTPLDGLSLVGQSYSRVNKRFTHDNSLDFSAKMKSVRLFGGLSYSDYRRNNTQDASIVMNTRGTQIHTMLDDIFSSEKEILYHAGAEYSKNERFWAGIKYNGSHNHTSSRTKSETKAVLLGGTDLVSGDNRVEDNTERHHLNAYIGRKWHEKFSSDLFLDFYTTEGDRKQSVIEQSSLMGNTDAIFNNQSAYTMLSAKPVFGYTLSSYLSSEFGGDYLYVSGESDQKNNGAKVSAYNTAETTLAGFVSLKTSNLPLSLQAGLRYENTTGSLDNLMDITQNLKLASSNFFGDFSASGAWGQTWHAFAIQNSIERPKFGWLNNYSYYSDHYASQLGNPTLQPAVSHQLQYIFFYQFIYASLSYTHTHNHIGLYFYTNNEEPDKLLTTWMNYHKNQRFQAIVNMGLPLGFYQPTLTSSVIFEKLDDERIEKIKTIPLFYLDFDNNFSLPWKLNLNIEYMYTSKATSQIFHFEPVHTINLGLSRSFWDNSFDVSIKCKDLFKGDISRYRGSLNNIVFSQTENLDKHSVSLNLTWRFNKSKDKYKGQSQDQTINRL